MSSGRALSAVFDCEANLGNGLSLLRNARQANDNTFLDSHHVYAMLQYLTVGLCQSADRSLGAPVDVPQVCADLIALYRYQTGALPSATSYIDWVALSEELQHLSVAESVAEWIASHDVLMGDEDLGPTVSGARPMAPGDALTLSDRCRCKYDSLRKNTPPVVLRCAATADVAKAVQYPFSAESIETFLNGGLSAAKVGHELATHVIPLLSVCWCDVSPEQIAAAVSVRSTLSDVVIGQSSLRLHATLHGVGRMLATLAETSLMLQYLRDLRAQVLLQQRQQPFDEGFPYSEKYYAHWQQLLELPALEFQHMVVSAVQASDAEKWTLGRLVHRLEKAEPGTLLALRDGVALLQERKKLLAEKASGQSPATAQSPSGAQQKGGQQKVTNEKNVKGQKDK